MKKQEVLFIVNPISGDIKKQNLPQLIEQHLDTNQFNWEIKYTERAGHASFIASDAVKNNIDIVVAVGGDGSINEIAKSIVNTKVALAIIPLGSGNGLAYHLNIPVKNIAKAIQLINTGNKVKIDTLSSNKGNIVSFAGTGFEAVAARTYRHLGKRGFLAYAWATIVTVLFNYKAKILNFEIDGKSIQENVYLFSIYNAKYLGYKVGKVAKASLTDGVMQILVVKKFSYFKLLWIALLELIGKMNWAKECTIYDAKKLTIHLTPKSDIQIDGDSFKASQDFCIEVNPLSLNIIVPKQLEKI